MRAITATAAIAVVAITGAFVAGARPGSSTSHASTSEVVDWSRVLATVDDARERAFAERRDGELRGVYTTASPLLTRDLATLHTLRTHGWRLRGTLPALVVASAARPAVVAAGPVAADSGTIALAAVESTPAYEIVDARGHVVRRSVARAPLHVVVTLQRVGQTWLVVTVETAAS